jgi:uncharacterized protein (TIGR00375 family)
MKFIADFHIHSKFSRATSKQMVPETIALWCQKKGIDIVATGDFTHPEWLRVLKEQLVELEQGLYVRRDAIYGVSKDAINRDAINRVSTETNKITRFICSAEISCIYSRGGKTRRIHIVVLAPNLETVEEINLALGKIGNLKSDGRPILGLDAEKLTEIILNINEKCLIIPAHIWTPWFALFGSKSGFNSFEECFGKYAKNIYAIETGLSSDPEMNWRISQIDSRTIISNSDAHSPDNLGREANVFSGEKIDYETIYNCLTNKGKGRELKLEQTIEFFPEEGKYHFDGHINCGVVMSPEESIKNKNICPKCRKELTLGVVHRVYELADRKIIDQKKRIPFKKLVPLREIIAGAMGYGKKAKRVEDVYERIIKKAGSEFEALINFDLENLKNEVDEEVIELIKKMRQGEIKFQPGYDGEYGKMKIVGGIKKEKQEKLF